MTKRRTNGRDSEGRARREEPGAPPSRRGLLRWVWGALGVAVAAEITWIVGSFLKPRPRRSDQSSIGILVAGPVDDFDPGTVTAFPAGKFYLARLESGGFLALYRECTHLGCTVPWIADEGRFDCPCHASSFDITGEVLGPPATRPLDRYPVRIENGIVKVDTSRRVRRSEFRESQVVHS